MVKPQRNIEFVRSRTSTIRQLRERIEKKLADKERVAMQLLEERKSLQLAKDEVVNSENAQLVLQQVAQTVQQQAHIRISSLVTKCLAMVFLNPYKCEIVFEKKRNKTEARVVFTRDGEQFDPMDSTGGGVIDIAAFALRLSSLALTIPKPRQILIMDEPMRNVSPRFRPRVRRMLELLSEELDMQFIIATNMSSLKTGTVIELE